MRLSTCLLMVLSTIVLMTGCISRAESRNNSSKNILFEHGFDGILIVEIDGDTIFNDYAKSDESLGFTGINILIPQGSESILIRYNSEIEVIQYNLIKHPIIRVIKYPDKWLISESPNMPVYE